MRILFYGDSITDAGRNREIDYQEASYGDGYVKYVVQTLKSENKEYDLINRGVSGDRIVDLYARIKVDCWNLQPDVLSILIGVNDVWHEIEGQNGVELERFEKIYRMLIEDTKKRLPNTKILLCEPFVLEGFGTANVEGKWEKFLSVYEYAAIVKKLANEYGLSFLPLQEVLSNAAKKESAAYYLSDGVHPAGPGAKLIANEWLKFFKEEIE